MPKEVPHEPLTRFGRWTLLSRIRAGIWLARCDCGTERSVQVRSLRNGRSISCGCLHTEGFRAMVTKHGLFAHHPAENRIWRGIKTRCYNPKATSYHHYGGRGITVCEAWRNSFATFLADMGPRPSPLHEVDRIDNDGNYEPENCRWATRAEQRRNTRTNRRMTIDGETRLISDVALERGLHPATVFTRIEAGASPAEALSAPSRGRERLVKFEDRTQNIKQWAKEKGLHYNTVLSRLRRGWPIGEALIHHGSVRKIPC